MRTFTRETDDMNEVLADFIGYHVTVKLTNGFSLTGDLRPSRDEYSDGYQIGSFKFEKKEVLEVTDYNEDSR